MEWVHEAEKCRGSLRFLLQRFIFFYAVAFEYGRGRGKNRGKTLGFLATQNRKAIRGRYYHHSMRDKSSKIQYSRRGAIGR